MPLDISKGIFYLLNLYLCVMKLRNNSLFIGFTCICVWILYSSNSLGFDNANYSGTSNSGRKCTHCHSAGADLGGAVQITMTDKSNNQQKTQFIEGRTYRMDLRITANSGKWKGIHASLVNAQNKTQGSLVNVLGGAIRTVQNIQFFTHYPANDSGVFAFDWTPNSSTSDSVSLFYAAIAGNGAGGNNGDQMISSTLKYYKDKTGNSANIVKTTILYPNPTTSSVYSSDLISGTVYNMVGQKMLSFKNTKEINIEALKAGKYFVQYSNGIDNYTKAVLKF